MFTIVRYGIRWAIHTDSVRHWGGATEFKYAMAAVQTAALHGGYILPINRWQLP